MPLSAGDRLGPYEIVGPLGAGGMGQVYRARDSKLAREVAVKVLPPELALDADYLARFQREAQSLAALNHPNIASIYGLEGNAIVMELVPGAPLRGPLALADALPLMRQVAEALEAAHERGIIHRDLKPGNVLVTADGVVKVLDFGLAKAVERPTVMSGADSPTLTLRATEAGLILGTAGYMSPEQAAGKPVDRRADIWAFGVVFYELLTGRMLFDGETVAHTLADVLRADIDLTLVPEGPIRELLARCLDRNLKNRLAHIAEARIAIDRFGAAPRVAPAAATKPSRLPWVVSALLLLGLIGASYAAWRAGRAVPQPVIQMTVDLGPDATAESEVSGPGFALSPDGRRIVYSVKNPAGGTLLATRLLDQEQATVLRGTENGQLPFFSPDGEWIGFNVLGQLKKVPVAGGAPFQICEAATGLRGGAWTEDGQIVFGTSRLPPQLSIVPATGGTPRQLTTLAGDEKSHRWPQVLPGGDILFLSTPTPSDFFNGQATIEVFSPKTGQRKQLHRGGYAPRYAPSGHLLFISQDVLFAAPMDPARLELTGSPVPILNTVSSDPRRAGNAMVQVAGNGLLLWRPQAEKAERELAWMDAAGKLERVAGSATRFGYRSLRLSPEGRRVAAFRPNAGLGVFDLDRGVWSPLTQDANDVGNLVWSRQGQHLFVRGLANDGVSSVRADGGGEPLPLGGGLLVGAVIGVSADGATLFVQGSGLLSMTLDWADPQRPKAGMPEPFSSLKAMRFAGDVSPDGRWMAGYGNVAGRDEIFVRSLGGDGIWQVSREGGRFAAWSPNGSELFYRDEQGPSRVFVVPYTAEGGVFRAGAARLWGSLPYRSGFDVSADGKRLLVTVAPEGAPEEKPTNELQMRFNFLDELKRRVPAGR